MNVIATSAHPANDHSGPRVAVLGLGPMGQALARALLDAGLLSAAWNRSSRALDGLPVVVDPVDATRDADVVLVCVRDHTAAGALVERVAPHLRAGVPLVNVSTGRPEEAVALAAAARSLGITYITGAIMVPTPLVGTDDNLVLYAGEAAAVEVARPALAALGGTVDVVGTDHGLPPVLDIAMLDVYFAGMYSFLHSAALVRAHGVQPSAYLTYATTIVQTLGASLPDLADAFEHRTYDTGAADLGMCLRFLEHITATSETAGVDARLPRLLRDLTREQGARSGHDVDWDVVAEGLTEWTSSRS